MTTTIRKSNLEFQPSDEHLQQIVASAQSNNYVTVQTLLKQSMRPKTKKDKNQSSVQWHEPLVLLQMYANLQQQSNDGVQQSFDTTDLQDDIIIPTEWKTITTTTTSTTMTIPNQMYRLMYAYNYYRQQNYSKVMHLYQAHKELTNESNSSSNNGTNGNRSDASSESATTATTTLFKIKLAWEHLHAQSLYHVQNGTAALQVYHDAFMEQQQPSIQKLPLEQMLQLYTNYMATVVSYFAVPYCHCTVTGIPHHDEIMTKIRQSLMLQTPNKSTTSVLPSSSLYYDLGYNVATYYLLTTTSTIQDRQEWLQVLFTYYHNHINESTYQIKDQFSLRMNYLLLRDYYWNMSNSVMNHPTNRLLGNDSHELLLFANVDVNDGIAQLSSQQQCVYRMNDAMLSLSSSMTSYDRNHSSSSSSSPERILQHLISGYVTAMGDKKKILTNLQQHIIHYNIAIYQYHCQQYMACQQTCQQYFLSATHNSKSNKKKKKPTTTSSNSMDGSSTLFEINTPAQYQTVDEKLFWECRATVLFVHCAVSMVISPPAADVITEDNKTVTMNSDTTQNDDAIVKVLALVVEMLNPFCTLSSTNTTNEPASLEVRNNVLLYARLHQHALQSKLSPPNGTSNIALQLLESLPDEIRTKPKLQSMIRKQRKSLTEGPPQAAVLQAESVDEKPTLSKLQEMVQSIDTFKSTLSKSQNDLQKVITYADFAISKQRYMDATILYKAVMDAKRMDHHHQSEDMESTTIMAKYVCALSYVRPNDAITIWSNMSTSNTVPDLISMEHNAMTNGSELEMKEIIFHNMTTTTTNLDMNTTTNENDLLDETTSMKKKKSREAVLRQRAKKREMYLQQKANGSSTGTMTQSSPPPDPERWLPKYERSSYAKYHRRNNNNYNNNSRKGTDMKSSQGIVSVSDMAKLDVVAHQKAATAAATGGDGTDASTIAALKSTAHMNVSNKGRGKKRR